VDGIRVDHIALAELEQAPLGLGGYDGSAEKFAGGRAE
jgi:hypothetical protein